MILNLVIPWFGNRNGGAEVYAHGLACALGQIGHEVHVLATCCPDPFHDWGSDGLPPGSAPYAPGVTLHRFPVRPRDHSRFAYLYGVLDTTGQLRDDHAEEFFSQSISSAELEEYLFQRPYEAFTIFMPYLYGTTIFGARRLPRERIILLPCLHNEPAAYTRPIAQLFERAGAALFLSDGERDLARALFGLEKVPHTVIGGGIELQPQTDPLSFRSQYGLTPDEPYLLAVGRKVPLKGQQLLVDLYENWVKNLPEDRQAQAPKLVIIGSGELHIPASATHRILNLSGVSDQGVQDATAGCTVFIHPSFVESFSLVMMQAWAHHKPVMANGECEVTLQSIRRSGGGMAFSSSMDFSNHLNRLLDHPDLRQQLGAAGRTFVEERCDWTKTAQRLTTFLESLPTQPPSWWTPPASPLAGLNTQGPICL